MCNTQKLYSETIDYRSNDDNTYVRGMSIKSITKNPWTIDQSCIIYITTGDIINYVVPKLI